MEPEIPVFCVHPQKFLYVAKHMLLKNIGRHMLFKNIGRHSLNLLNFVYIVVFDIEIALEDTKLAPPEGQDWQIFFPISRPWWGQIKNFHQENFWYFT